MRCGDDCTTVSQTVLPAINGLVNVLGTEHELENGKTGGDQGKGQF